MADQDAFENDEDRRDGKPDEHEGLTPGPDRDERGGSRRRGGRPLRSEREKFYRNEAREFPRLARALSLKAYETDHYFKPNGLPLDDLICSLLIRAFYHNFSSRRADYVLEEARQKGFIKYKPAPNTLLHHLQLDELTPVLEQLVGISYLPFVLYDKALAIDTTKMYTEVVLKADEVKKGGGKGKRKRVKWVKLHVVCGVRSLSVTSARVTPWPTREVRYFKPMLEEAASRGTVIRSVLADSGYVSKENCRLVLDGLGADFYLSFKWNNKMSKKGADPDWDAALERYRLREGVDFLPYRERNMVETVHGMIVRRFGRAVRGLTERSQFNECMLKVIGHNLCRLIRYHTDLDSRVVATDNQTGLENGVL